ncbi:MAG: translocation/assembly module TamB domain-containing protein [Thermodesulfovibrionales bacterium]|nr:translocation/assembly module TamB domain-containing protein [Thermodesulfovibrionales bacterium]
MRISRKKLVAGTIVLVVALGFALFLRSPYVSNALKKAILKEMRLATGHQVMAAQMYVNVFPMFVGFSDLNAFDEKGEKVFSSERVKAYVSLTHVFSGTIAVDRIVLEGAGFWGNSDKLEKLRSHLSGKKGREADRFIKLDIRTVVFRGASASYFHVPGKTSVRVQGADLELVLKESPVASFAIKDVAVSIRDWPVLSGGVKGKAKLEGNALKFDSFKIESFGSEVTGAAEIRSGEPSVFSLDAMVIADTVKRILGLDTDREGTVYAKGGVTLAPKLIDTSVDLELGGFFHLDTLLEALGVKDPFGLAGKIDFKGTLNGPVTALEGEAKGTMEDGDLFGIHADRLASTVTFSNNVLGFPDLVGDVYGGRATGEAYLKLPRITDYSVDISFDDADSGPVRELVNIKWLPLPHGKVEGRFRTSGSDFAPYGRFSYRVAKGREDPLGRVQTVRGSYSMKDKVLRLDDINARTMDAHLVFSGSADLRTEGLDFSGYVLSTNLTPLLTPYFGLLSGGGRVDASVSGTVRDPVIRGSVTLWDAMLGAYTLGGVRASAEVGRDALHVYDFLSRSGNIEHRIEGNVGFSSDSLIPPLDALEYDLYIRAENGDLGALISLLGLGSGLKGSLDTDVTFKGRGREPVINGDAVVRDATVYGRHLDLGRFGYQYSGRTFSMYKGAFSEAGHALSLEGDVSLDRTFNFNASSPGVRLGHLIGREPGVDYLVRFSASGSGTFEDPRITLEGDLRDGALRKYPLWDAALKATLIGRHYDLSARSINGKANMKLNGSLSGDMPWSADVRMSYGRYDFLLGPFMKDPPDDLVLGLEGNVSLWGTRKTVNADANIRKALVSIYGQGFNTLSDVKLTLRDRVLSIPSLSVRSGTSRFSVSCRAEIGKSMDIAVKGRASLVPVPVFVPALEAVKGSVAIDMRVKGDWGAPVFIGAIDLVDVDFSFKDKPQRVTGLSGKILLEEGRAFTEAVKARIGGGSVKAAGSVMLEGLNVSRLRLDLALSDISYYISRNFITHIGGNILVTGDASRQKITGELWIEKAVYGERIDWKSWLVSGGVRAPRKVGGWMRDVGLNLRVFGSKNIRVDNNIADAPLTVDLVMRGTLEFPLLLGRIESHDGKVFFRNTQFRIIRATADFADTTSSAPFISIRAQSSVGGYFIWLTLEGKLEQMDLTLTSDPPLDDVEILGLLTLGGSGGSLDGLEGGIGAAEATSLLTGQVQDEVEERFTDITGLDRVLIAPSVSRVTGDVVPRVTVSKRLLGDKLFVTYSSTLGDENEQEMNIEYVLGENVSLVGGQENTGSVGGDLKFRFRFE